MHSLPPIASAGSEGGRAHSRALGAPAPKTGRADRKEAGLLKKARAITFRVIQAALLLLIAWGIYRSIAPELGRMSAADFARYRPAAAPLAGSLLLLLAVYLAHGILWRVIAQRLADRPIGLREAMRVYFVSSLGRYIPGKLWQIAGLAALAHRANFPPVAATAASLVGQLAFMTTGMLFLAMLVPDYGAIAWIAAALLVLAVGTVFIVTGTRLGADLRHRIAGKVGPRFGDALNLLDRVRPLNALGWWIAYAITWVVLGSAFGLFVYSFVPAAANDPARLAGTVAASYLGGYISLMPAGIGVRELAMIGLLKGVIGAPAAVVVSAVSRLWFTAGELLPLAVIPLLPATQAVEGSGAAV